MENVFQLFQDLATLVDMQSDQLNIIEQRVVQSKDYVEKGLTNLREAEDYQTKARKRNCCILIIVLIIIIVIVAPILGTQLKNT